MNEDDLKKLLNECEIPAASQMARDGASNAAWERLQESLKPRRQRRRLFSMPVMRTATLVASLCIVMFGGLSYMVSSSSRSGGKDANNETNLVSSSAITQYPASVRTAIVRMMVQDKVRAKQIRFDLPRDWKRDAGAEAFSFMVFHPDGGGAVYVQAPADVMSDGKVSDWYFNAEFEIFGIGSDVSGVGDGNELIAFLPGVKRGVCQLINEEFGIVGDIKSERDLSPYYNRSLVSAGVWPDGELVIGGNETPSLKEKAFGCFENADGTMVYYHTLLEN